MELKRSMAIPRLLLLGLWAAALRDVVAVAGERGGQPAGGRGGRPLPVAALTALFGGFQALAHGAFHAVVGTSGLSVGYVGHADAHLSAGHVAAGHGLATATHGMHAITGLSGVSAASGPSHAAVSHAAHLAAGGHAMGLSPLMVTSHLLATVLLAWLLGPAVRQVRAIVRRATPQVPVLVPASVPLPFLTVPSPVVARDVVAAVGLRGPPRLARA